MKKKIPLLRIYRSKPLILLLLTICNFITAQVQISFGTTAVAVNPQSILHLESASNNKGFLLTRLELQAVSSPSPLASHIAGMIIYNTATAGTSPDDVTPGLYYNNGSMWIKMTTKTPVLGDIKNGFQSADHNGWYLVNGRAVTTLAVRQRAVAVALGFTTNLPDASDRYLKNKSTTDAIGAVAGIDTFTIARANLPNVTFSGTTNTAGSHTHTYTDNPVTAINVVGGTNNPVASNVALNTATNSSGSHTHTLSFALGSSQAVNFEPSNIITNVFIYLGN